MERNFRVLVSPGTLFKNKTRQHQQQQKPGWIFFFIQGMEFSEGNLSIQAIYNKNKSETKSHFGRRGSLIQQPWEQKLSGNARRERVGIVLCSSLGSGVRREKQESADSDQRKRRRTLSGLSRLLQGVFSHRENSKNTEGGKMDTVKILICATRMQSIGTIVINELICNRNN